MAYFQMDKNPFRELKTEGDYKEWTKMCYRSAKAFFNVSYNVHHFTTFQK